MSQSQEKSNKDMIIFYLKLFSFQTIMYLFLYFIVSNDTTVTNDERITWNTICIGFYFLSVLFTIIIPLVKMYFDNKNVDELESNTNYTNIINGDILDISDISNNDILIPFGEYKFEIKADIRNFTQDEFSKLLDILGQVNIVNFNELVELYETRFNVKR